MKNPHGMKVSRRVRQAKPATPMQKMNVTPSFLALSLGLALTAVSPAAFAANFSWFVDTNSSWNAAGSWDGSSIPGSTTLLNSTDTAIFGKTLTVARTVTVDANRNIGGITFDNAGAFKYTLSGGNLRLTNGGVIQTAAGNAAQVDTISSGIAIQGDGGSATFTGGATLGTSILSIATVTGVSSGPNVTTLTLNGTNTGANVITGIIGNGGNGGKLAIVKSDAGTWGINGANTFTGGLTVNGGTLSTSVVAGFGAGSITLGNGTGGAATLLSTANVTHTNNIAVTVGSGLLTINGQTNSQTFSGAIALNNDLTLANLTAAKTTTFSNTITGGSTLTIGSSNLGIVAITGANGSSYTGATVVNAGNLNFGNHGLGDGSATINLAGGTLQYAAATNTQDVASRLITTGANTAKIDVNNNAVTFGSALTAANIAGSGGVSVTSSTAGGSLLLTGAQTYTGLTSVGAGATLKLATSATLNSGNALTTLASGTFDINGNSQTLGTVTNNGLITNNGSGTPTLTIGGASNTAGTGSITGALNLVLNGSGATTTAVGTANNLGTITNSGVTTGLATITTVGTNVTGITQDSAAGGGLTLTTLNVASGGTTLTSYGTSLKVFTVNTVQGSGDLLFVNNATTGGNTMQVTTGGVNHTGKLTNIGTGTGNTSIAVSIGSNVGLITQNSNGTLILSGSNINTNGVALQAGILKLSSTNALGATASTLTISGGSLDSGVANLVLANNNTQNWNSSFGFVGTNGLNIGTGAVAIGTANPTVTVTSNTLTVGGVITDSGRGLTKAGAGTLALTGANGSSYTGTTGINGGTLNFTSGALGTGAVTFGGSSTLQWAAGNTQDISNKALSSTGFTGTLDLGANNVTFATANGLTGSGNFTKAASAGILTLNASNNFTGTYTASATLGTTLLKNANALSLATVTPGATTGITFDSSVGGAFTFGNLSGAGALVLQDNLGAAITLSVGNNNSSPLAYTGTLSGAGSLNKIGSGSLTLNNNFSSFTGGVTLSSGTLNINQQGAPTTGPLGNGGTFTINGGTLDTTAGSARVELNNNPISIGGSFAYSNPAGINSNNNITLPGAIAMAADHTITLNGAGALLLSNTLTNTGDSVRTLTVNNGATDTTFGSLTLGGYALTGAGSTAARNNIINGSGNVTISGVVSDGVSAGSGLTYAGTGALTISGVNTFTGPLSILSGTVSAGNASAGNTLGGGTITIGNTSGIANATLAISDYGNGAYPNAVTVAGGNSGVATITLGSSSNTGTAGGITGLITLHNHDLTVATTAGQLCLPGGMTTDTLGTRTVTVTGPANAVLGGNVGSHITDGSGQIRFVQNGTGILFFSGSNAFTGEILINSGTVAQAVGSGGNDANFGANNTIYIGATGGGTDNATLAMWGNGGTTITNNITVRGGGINTLKNQFSNQTDTTSGLLTLNADLTAIYVPTGSGGVVIGNSTTGTFLTGSHNITFQNDSGTSSNVLSGNNPGFLGNVTIQSGGFKVNSATALSSANTVTVDSLMNAPTFNMNGNDQTIAGLNDGANGGGTVTNTGAAKTLTLGGSGTYAFSGVISGTGVQANMAITKSGLGTQTLSGVNTYTGTTKLLAGTLKAGNDSAFGSSVITVNGGTLNIRNYAVANTINVTGASTVLMTTATTAQTANYANGISLAGWQRAAVGTIGATTASLLSGTAAGASAVTTSWTTNTHSGGAAVITDVLNLAGTGAGNPFVLQMTYTDDANDATAMLGYWNSSQWVNAIYGGGFSGPGTFVNGAYTGTLAPGTWGRDTGSNQVWAVVNHNSEFAVVVPEPAALALLALGGLALLRRRRESV